MFVAFRRMCIVYSVHGGDDRITRLSTMNAYPQHKISPSISKLVLKCNNPLYYHTESCRILWDSIDCFNERVKEVEYSIDHRDDDLAIDDDMCDDPNYAHTEECRVYDL